jgi:hypothetical protein
MNLFVMKGLVPVVSAIFEFLWTRSEIASEAGEAGVNAFSFNAFTGGISLGAYETHRNTLQKSYLHSNEGI